MLSKLRLEKDFVDLKIDKVYSFYFNFSISVFLFNLYIYIRDNIDIALFVDIGEELWESNILLIGEFLNVK